MDIIGAPTFLGCDRQGPEQAPDFLRREGLVSVLRKTGCEVYDLGNIPLPAFDETEKFADGSNMKYIDQVCELDRNLAEAVYASSAGGAVPFTIGGDHSIALGSISGSATYHDRLGVIWIDAHGDINTADTSPSGNIHGMCLAALMGFGDERLTGLYDPARKVDPRDVILLGIRSLDDGEKELIAREGITVFYMEDIKRDGIEATMDRLLAAVGERGLEKMHCSLDIDVLDPEFAPGTGTTVENGMHPDELFYALDSIFDRTRVVSCDLVELNPVLDTDGRTTRLAIDLAGFMADSMS